MDVAIKKAKTSRFFDMPTGEIGKLSQPGGPLYNIEHSNAGLISFPGGVPLKNKQGEIVGPSRRLRQHGRKRPCSRFFGRQRYWVMTADLSL